MDEKSNFWPNHNNNGTERRRLIFNRTRVIKRLSVPKAEKMRDEKFKFYRGCRQIYVTGPEQVF